jgi:hypothetical protein
MVWSSTQLTLHALTVDRMNVVNKVNVVNMWKSATFTTYPHETKGVVNVVNVVRGYFACGARRMPNSIFTNETPYRNCESRRTRAFQSPNCPIAQFD